MNNNQEYNKKQPNCIINQMRNDSFGFMANYFKMSQTHARISFVLSVLCCIVGFLLFFIALLITFSSMQIKPILICTISGAISEIISATMLWIHKKTLKQLNFYFLAINRNQQFLAIRQLITALPDDKNTSLYIDLLHEEIKSLRNYNDLYDKLP